MSKPSLKALFETMPQQGSLQWIGLRPERRAPLEVHRTALVSESEGLVGDHFAGRRTTKRQVTLIQAEHIETVAAIMGKPVEPELLRRNLVVAGINLLALKDSRFAIGDEVILEGTGLCHPCSRMEENLGPGGYNAMRGHGGLTARVIRGGTIRVGDAVRFLPGEEGQSHDR